MIRAGLVLALLAGCTHQPSTMDLQGFCDVVRHDVKHASDVQIALDWLTKRTSEATTHDVYARIAAAPPAERYTVFVNWAHRFNPVFECEDLRDLWAPRPPPAQ